jgi:hypothetical protein
LAVPACSQRIPHAAIMLAGYTMEDAQWVGGDGDGGADISTFSLLFHVPMQTGLQAPARRTPTCGYCQQPRHNRRRCPDRLADEAAGVHVGTAAEAAAERVARQAAAAEQALEGMHGPAILGDEEAEQRATATADGPALPPHAHAAERPPRQCRYCLQAAGHDRRNCPDREADEADGINAGTAAEAAAMRAGRGELLPNATGGDDPPPSPPVAAAPAKRAAPRCSYCSGLEHNWRNCEQREEDEAANVFAATAAEAAEVLAGMGGQAPAARVTTDARQGREDQGRPAAPPNSRERESTCCFPRRSP